MRSIKTLMLTLVCIAMVGVYVLLALSSAFIMRRSITENARQTQLILTQQKTNELNERFEAVERAVSSLSTQITDEIDVEFMKNDPTYHDAFMESLSIHCADAAKVIGAVEAVYFRLDPEVYGGTAGLFLTADGFGDYISAEPTDLTAYASDETERVGWFYEPMEYGKSMWMLPYFNNNISVLMVSYVSPLYTNGKFLGVVGMDINMSKIHSVVDTLDFANGYGFLVDEDGNLVYHPDYPEGLKTGLFDEDMRRIAPLLTKQTAADESISRIQWRGEPEYLSVGTLSNDMLLAIAIPEAELLKPIQNLHLNLLLILLAVLAITLVFSALLIRLVISPIKQLTTASERIAKGELSVPISYHSNNEIGKLADSVRLMGRELQEYISYIHSQAYTDAMTGVGNKSAYLDTMRLMDRKIQEGMADFAVVVFDVNGLKRVNDELGHEFGDKLICDAATVIKTVYGAEHVYRIGGDEFIVILENIAEGDLGGYYLRYDEELNLLNTKDRASQVKLAVSKGAAVFASDTDTCYKEVFRRADQKMYEDKEAYYKNGNDRRRRR